MATYLVTSMLGRTGLSREDVGNSATELSFSSCIRVSADGPAVKSHTSFAADVSIASVRDASRDSFTCETVTGRCTGLVVAVDCDDGGGGGMYEAGLLGMSVAVSTSSSPESSVSVSCAFGVPR